jgi:hypothetical protein
MSENPYYRNDDDKDLDFKNVLNNTKKNTIIIISLFLIAIIAIGLSFYIQIIDLKKINFLTNIMNDRYNSLLNKYIHDLYIIRITIIL